MKILCAFYDINNPGGIVNHQEHLTRGLKALGHEVDARLLMFKPAVGGARAVNRRSKKQERGILGMDLDQDVGWFWPASRRVAYRGDLKVGEWQRFASRYDLVIWQIPVPTMRSDQRGNSAWPGLYDLPPTVRQLAVIHDGNMPDAYPWIYQVADRLTALVGVHGAGANSAARVPLPYALIPNPHWNMTERVAAADAVPASQRRGWFSCQTFKGWKRVDELVRAVPHMQSVDAPRVLAGGGIEYYYMNPQAKEKIKSKYLASPEHDPDLPVDQTGRKIWDRALEAGMDYRGYLTNEQRDEAMRAARFVIDPSWNRKYAAIGDHFNRTPIEAIISGCVPICRDLGVACDPSGRGELFEPGVNYVMIPHDATPRRFAELVDRAMRMDEGARARMLRAGRELLPMFDATTVAEWYVRLATDPASAVDGRVGTRGGVGREDAEMRAAGERAMREFFGGQAS